MKARELMIGDWVKIIDLKDPIKQISCIDEYLGKVDFWDAEKLIVTSINNVLPIPLTAEILEKNGFTRYGTDYILEGEHFGLDNPSNPNNYLDNYWLRISIKAVHIEYVHELQHALRMCGVEKDITI